MPKQMTQQPTPLEAMWKEIDDKADTYARNQSGYILDGNELGAENNPQKLNYDRIKRHCKALATPYGERLVAAEELIEKMKGALEAIADSSCDYESINYAKAIHNPECRACNAMQVLNDYQTYLKTRKDGTEQ